MPCEFICNDTTRLIYKCYIFTLYEPEQYHLILQNSSTVLLMLFTL